MRGKEKRRRKKLRREDWFLYLLKCRDGSFYTGITNNLERRFALHNAGRASRYTRTRRPVQLVYRETCSGRTDALVRECAVKAYSRKQKEKLAGRLYSFTASFRRKPESSRTNLAGLRLSPG